MITLNEIKGLSNIHNLPKAIHVNEHIMMDPYLDANLSDSPKTITYDFDVFLKDYGVNLQRPYVWNPIQQQEFIISILLEKPIPPMILVEIDTEESISGRAPRKMLVIDGKQRLMTIKRFIDNEFPISVNEDLIYFGDFDKELHLFFIRRITDLEATIYYASDNPSDEWYISDDMKIALFNFYNFAGTPQEYSHKVMLHGFLENSKN